jgi:hypothetical protein
MADRNLTQDLLQSLLIYDKESGYFFWKVTSGGAVKGKKAGYVCKRHIQIRINKKLYYAHRLAWIYVYGREPDSIDHINGNPTDNRICNLRSVTHQTNMENLRRATTKNACGFLGVETVKLKTKIKYVARIIVKNKRYTLGHAYTPEEAHQIYLEGKRKLHKGCTI